MKKLTKSEKHELFCLHVDDLVEDGRDLASAKAIARQYLATADLDHQHDLLARLRERAQREARERIYVARR